MASGALPQPKLNTEKPSFFGNKLIKLILPKKEINFQLQLDNLTPMEKHVDKNPKPYFLFAPSL